MRAEEEGTAEGRGEEEGAEEWRGVVRSRGEGGGEEMRGYEKNVRDEGWDGTGFRVSILASIRLNSCPTTITVS